MSVGKKIVISLISILVVAGLAVAGIFLFKPKNQEYNLNGSVKFAVEGGVSANIQGDITGEAKDKKLNSLVYSVINKPNESALNSWENIKLNFEDKSQPIKITIIVNNTDTEDMLFVELVGSVGESDNVKKVVKLNGEDYQNNQIVELASYGNQENSRAIFNIELSIIDIEQEVKDVDFTYQINLYKEYVETEKLVYIFNDENQTVSVKMQSTEVTTGKVIIPETVIAPNGLPYTVTSIEPSGFSDCSELTSVTLPDTLITVGDNAFKNCVNLAYTIKENGRYLGNANNPYMFLSGPEDGDITTFNVNSSCKILGYRAFMNVSTLETINLPDGLISMGNAVFNYCTNLKSIDMPDSVIDLGLAIFQFCENLKTVKLSKNISNITSWMFNQCSNIETIILPESVTKISKLAFQRCVKLKNVTLSKSLTKIEDRAFYQCKSLEKINMENVIEFGQYAFYNCVSLTSITFSSELVFIGSYAFAFCSAVTNTVITIPASIKQIGGEVYDPENPNLNVIGSEIFFNCGTNSIVEFEMSGENENFGVVDGVLYRLKNGKPDVLIAYPPAKQDSKYIMPNSVTNSFECAMSRPYYLKEIVLSDNYIIEKMNENAWSYEWASNINAMIHRYSSVVTITCNETNPNYMSYNGQVYSKDGKILYYASDLSGLDVNDETAATLTLKEGVTTISFGAIGYNVAHSNNVNNQNTDKNNHLKQYEKILIPASVISIDSATLTTINAQNWIIEVEEGNAYYEVINNKLAAKV